jgi:hypothetical protein
VCQYQPLLRPAYALAKITSCEIASFNLRLGLVCATYSREDNSQLVSGMWKTPVCLLLNNKSPNAIAGKVLELEHADFGFAYFEK